MKIKKYGRKKHEHTLLSVPMMLAHSAESAEVGNGGLLKLSDMPVIMSASPAEQFHAAESGYPHNGYSADTIVASNGQQYYQHYDLQVTMPLKKHSLKASSN